MKRPGYREAVEWIAMNDDMDFLDDDSDFGISLSVAASLVRDLFNVTDDKIIADLRRAVEKDRNETRKTRGEQEHGQ